MKKAVISILLLLPTLGQAQQSTTADATPAGTVPTSINFPVERLQTPTAADVYCAGFIGKPIYVDEDIGIAVRKQDDALRQRLNAALARIRLDGTYQKINAKYFPFSIY